MNHPCCRDSGGETPAKWRSRLADLAAWTLPGVLLAATPKCPMCVAAYVALATGVGLSAATASWLWAALLLLFAGSLAYAAVRTFCSFRAAARAGRRDTQP